MGVLRPNPCFILVSEESGKEAKLVLHTVCLRFISLKLACNSDTMSFIQDFELGGRGGGEQDSSRMVCVFTGGGGGLGACQPPRI